ncbi:MULTISPECIES: DUF6603 domain-containing protein [unclassified Chelatococcus]|uniref:DUF6603 domain-containing protein n=1 Tax=unclassified Chelatococcus TaxID=2638111 RepID=UPI001BD1006C|nr:MULTISPECIES: DUF6603 domain-containing protein [unclassified Chelatococcus]CAH1656428.1 conserved hypothetical protein [Hyphomicrobiales bacterium]MBS7742455.1 hypothetical protein [Chelatococcus sp. HY11]MBX3542427.1 hypothetical protein [Chelatococcus sp.]MCO5075356.1 hypothetical protein [Chelatococcus sp.]CAH1695845.1 conserved hypothetical protein [Hyphomicrobiales bacterium]
MSQNALTSLLCDIAVAFGSIADIDTPERAAALFAKLGYAVPGATAMGALAGLKSAVAGLGGSVRASASIDTDNGKLAANIDLLARLAAVADAMRQVQSALQGAGVPNLGELVPRLTDHLLLDHIDRAQPQLHEGLLLIGLIDRNEAPAAGQPMRRINWRRLSALLTAPGEIARDVYRFDTNLDIDLLLARLEKLMRASGMPGGRYPQAAATKAALGNAGAGLPELRFPFFQKGFTPETYSQFGITISPAEATGGKRRGVALLPYIRGGNSFQFNVCDRGELVFSSTTDIRKVGFTVRPPFTAEGLFDLTGAFGASIAIREKKARAEEVTLIGSPGGTRLSVQGLGFNIFAGTPQGKLDLGVEAEIGAFRFVIDAGKADGFLQKVLSGLHVEAETDLAFGMALLSGFTFRGGGKLALELSTHIDLGPAKLDGIRLGLGPSNDRFSLDTGALLKFDLGPLKAVVEDIGLSTSLDFRPGNLGPAHLSVGFKPPKGVGLSVDAGIVTGGGYLSLDPERGEYAGAIELSFSGIVALKAFGLISTRMPDGTKGFSLVIIISVEFGTGIQLGFGFTLLAVGGLIGLNRTMNLEALMDGVRTGSIESIMFPRDVVANAPKIISDLRTLFPAQEGTFLIGPMAKLGWGTPTLVSVSLGIIIEIPGNIAIIGVLKVAIPAEDAPLIILQVNFAGAIEFDKQRIYFFASLFESRVVFLTIDGEMGLLVAFGDDANFVVSVGGFHPRFAPPPLPFPSPRRISVSLLSTPLSRVRIEGYFAVTANTVQFGARVEVYFGFSALNVKGHLAFDALFQFSPFRFIIEISASLSANVFGAGLFSVRVRGELQGPAKWRIRGQGSISLLFWDVDVDINESWGESADTLLPPIAVLPLLAGEYAKMENWRAILPAGNGLFVTLRKMPAEEAALVLHPVGLLAISQRTVPLAIKLDKIGNQAPSDVNRLTIDVAGGGLAKRDDAFEPFAPAQFQNFSDADKLSRPAFAPEKSGLHLSAAGADLRTSRMVKRIVRYEEIIIDNNFKRFTRRFFLFAGTLFNFFLNGAAITHCALSKAAKKQLDPFEDKITVMPETFTVAFQATNKAFAANAGAFRSEASARQFMNDVVANDPTLMDAVHVIPSYERAA